MNDADRLSALDLKLSKCLFAYENALTQCKEYEQKKDQLTARAESALMAKELVLTTAKLTQLNIGQRIVELVGLALASVWASPYEFKIEFVEKRGQTEAELYFLRDGHMLEPMFNSGGGVLDIASLALRFAIWSLNKTQGIFILDEPFRNLHSPELNEKASIMLNELAERLGIQIIMAAADDNIIYGANRIFTVTQNGIEKDN